MSSRKGTSGRVAGAVLLALQLLISRPVAAQSYPGSTGSLGNLFGQTQAYDVLLRGNGEAVVNARVTLTNSNKEDLSKLDYTVVHGSLGSVSAFQEITCTDLPVLLRAGNAGAVATDTTASPNSTSAAAPVPPSNSIENTDLPECYPQFAAQSSPPTAPDGAVKPYVLPYYYPSGLTYKKITVSQTGDRFTLALPQAIKSNKSATVVMLYTLTGVAKKQLGAYHFDFKTLRSTSAVSEVYVSLSVDENYYLADAAKGNVNYRPAATSSALDTSLKAGTALNNGTALNEVNTYVNNIGYNGSLTKHASSLAANETFTVQGSFATSTFLLHWQRTALWWGILLLVVVAMVYWYLRRRKQLIKSGKPQPATVKMPAASEPPPAASPKVPAKTTGNPNLRALPFYGVFTAIRRQAHERRVRPMFVGWVCAALTIGWIAALVWAGSTISNLNNYGSGDLLYPVLSICIVIVGILGFFLLCVGLPVLYAGTFRRALRIFVHMLLFFMAAGLLLIVILVNVQQSGNGGGPCSSPYAAQTDAPNTAIGNCIEPL